MHNKREILESLRLRYSPELYHLANHGSITHFRVGIKSIISEIVKTNIGLLTLIFRFFAGLCTQRDRYSDSKRALAIYSTGNQYRVISNAIDNQIIDASLHSIYQFSIVYLLLRNVVWTARLFIYPVLFPFVNRDLKKTLHLEIFTMFEYRNLGGVILRKAKRLGAEEIVVSNDHCGDVYLLGLFLRGKEIGVTYIQHGAVNKYFPENYFNRIYVYDEASYAIYQTLSQEVNVDIRVDPRILESKIETYVEPSFALVCLSHQFYVFQTIKLLYFLSKAGKGIIYIRFHPSDRLLKIKFIILRVFFHRLKLSCSLTPFEHYAEKSNRIISASSSVLRDSCELGYHLKTVWYVPIGLNWDYYEMRGKIVVVDTDKSIQNVIKSEEF